MKRILYVELNEDGTVGGSHGILYDLVTRLPGDFEPVVLFYEDNPWVARLRAEGIEVHVWTDRRRRESASLAGSRLNTVKAMGGLTPAPVLSAIRLFPDDFDRAPTARPPSKGEDE